MRYQLLTIGILALLLNTGGAPRLETREFSELEPATPTARRIKWPRRTIEVTFSNSLRSPAAHIKPGSDVVGAARRALSRWSNISGLSFVISWSSEMSVSPADQGDGISLITIADTPDNEAFNADSTTGRTRVFFDPESGAIQEADISINPKPRSAEGADLQFSTDGTPGTYDLEATFTHEVGHLLGLDHSNVLASTMQSHQAFNGTYGLPAFTERTLTEEDRQRVRSLYGPKQRIGKIEGHLFDTSNGTFTALKSIHVWAESLATGRVVASDVSADDGTYVLSDLPPGRYRVLAGGGDEAASGITAVGPQRMFGDIEISNQVNVKESASTTVNYNVLPQATAKLNPRLIGLNGDLSVVALPLEPGKRFKIYLSGEGIDNVPGTSISVNSPYFTVDAASLTREQFQTSLPVVSFDVNVAANAPFGDYTLRLQSNSGELAYVPGALTIDPGVTTSVANPIDDPRFFVNQHYKDVTGRTPTADLLDRLTSQLSACGTRNDCLRNKLDLSNTLMLQDDVSASAGFIYGLYQVGLGRRPKFSEFENDRNTLNRDGNVEENRLALAMAFVSRPEFERKYARLTKADQFVDGLTSSIAQTTGLNAGDDRQSLLSLFDGTNAGRAKILVQLITQPALVDAQYNQSLVLLHYFAYLRRDPDKANYDYWVNVLKSKPLRDPAAARSMACSLLNSSEYQSRFAMVATHNPSECTEH
ncbi:MAG TPA: matrixin family metalloprotease [Pyrinomonadaceae bacterium]